MRFIRPSVLALAALLVGLGTTSAQVVTFAQWNSQTNDVPIVNYVDNGTSATLSGTFLVDWLSFSVYTNAARTGAAPNYPISGGLITAQVNFSITTTTNGTVGSTVEQPFTSTDGTMTINAVTPIDGLTNLLTMTFRGNFSGTTGGTSGTLSGSTPSNTVTYTSQFVSFANSTSRSYSGAFNTISPVLALTGNFMDSWTAQFAQFNFSSNGITRIPEPSTWAMIGGVGAIGYYLHRRRLAKQLAAEKAAPKEGQGAEPVASPALAV